MDKTIYRKVASDEAEPSPTHSETSPTVVVSSPASPESSVQFAKAALIFHDQLGDIRKKHASVTTTAVSDAEVSKESPQSTPVPAEPAGNIRDGGKAATAEDPFIARRMRIVRLVQSTATAVLSIAIAALQAKAYSNFESTKDVPGAWPSHPNLLPTLLLLGVAIGSIVFDLSLLGAYIFPRRAASLFRIATTSHTTLTAAKGLSYALTSIVCRGGFNWGNSSGNNSDLWGWSCSAQGDMMNAVNQAEANCMGQTCAWCLAMAQVVIEAIGVVGGYLVRQWGKGGIFGGVGSAGSRDLEAEFKKLETWGKEIDTSLAELTPKIGQEGS